jgi:hypothetical protein
LTQSGESLESRRNIGRLTKSKLFLPPSNAYVAHHNQTSVDAEPYRQANPLVLLEASIQSDTGRYTLRTAESPRRMWPDRHARPLAGLRGRASRQEPSSRLIQGSQAWTMRSSVTRQSSLQSCRQHREFAGQ